MKKTKTQRQLEQNFDRVKLVGSVHTGRHGVAKRKPDGAGSLDELDEKILEDGHTTINHMYSHGKRAHSLNDELGYTGANTFIYRSPMQRTLETARAVALGRLNSAGLFRRKPSMVQDLESAVQDGDLSGVRVVTQKDLGYGHIKMNIDAFKKGEAFYFDAWAGNPNSKKIDGVEVTPYSHMIGMGDEMLLRIYNEVSNERPNGVVISHGSIAEAIHLAALNSVNPDIRENMERMGGAYSMEDSSEIRFYEVELSGHKGLVASIRRYTKNGQPVEGEETLIRLSNVKEDLQYRMQEGIYKSQSSDTKEMTEEVFAI